MDELFKLIDSRIEKKNSSLKSVPCKVINVFDDSVDVELISNKARYLVQNYSGSFVQVGDIVQLHYKSLIGNNAYIANSPYKDMSLRVLTIDSKQEFIGNSDYGNFAQINFIAEYDTTINLICNASILGMGSAIVDVAVIVDGTEYPYVHTVSVRDTEYSLLNFCIPIQCSTGNHNIVIKAKGACNIVKSLLYINGQHIVKGAEISYDDTSDDDYITITENNSTTIVRYVGESKSPKVLSSINGNNVTKIASSGFNASNIEVVYIPDGVVEIE